MSAVRKKCTHKGYTAVGNDRAGVLFHEAGFADPYLARKYGMVREIIGKYANFNEALSDMKVIIARENAPVTEEPADSIIGIACH